MRKILFLFLATLAGIPLSAQTPPGVKSEITEVTVFLSGAQVTREATVTVESGQSQLFFRGLETGIDPKNIQVTAPPEVVINSVVHQVNYLQQQDYSPQVKKLRDSLLILIDLMALESDQQIVLDQEGKMILANQKLAGKSKGVSIAELEKASAFYRQRLTDIEARSFASRKRVEKHQLDQNRITSQLNELNYKRNQSSNDIQVTVNSFSTRKIALRIRYMVANAGWIPGYDLRANDIVGPIRIDYRADVFQNTGINWDKVNLTLSSGNPNLGGSKPSLSPWNLYIYRTEAPVSSYDKDGEYKNAEPEAVMAEDDMAEDEAAPPPAPEADFEEAFRSTKTLADYTYVREGATTAEFLITIPQDIPSDGKGHKVSIQSRDLPAEFQHTAIPKLDRDAFLLARVTGWEDLNLLAGNANIFFEGTYVAETSIDPSYTSDTLEFSLGRDKKVVIDRKQLQDFNQTRTIGINRERTFGYEITVRNNKSQKVKLRLEDQIPISQDKDIIVKVLEITGGEHDLTTGKLTWDLELGPSESKSLRLVFSVKHPKNQTISGL